MKILLAPDKFKGSLPAADACELIEEGLRGVMPEATIESCPIADGGDGFMEVLRGRLGGVVVDCEVQDALGRPIQARYALCGQTAVMEMSEASGIRRIREEDLDIWRAHTHGTGEMIRHAVDQAGVNRIVLGVGGSASNDAGCGMAEALGVRFLDQEGKQLKAVPESLLKCASVDRSACIALPEILVACDVTNPLLGPQGAVRVYAPQKGARVQDLERLEELLARIVNVTGGEQTSIMPGAGAAGGLGFGLLEFCDATLVPGFELVARETGLGQKIAASDVVVTGEGKLDSQTLQGKGPGGVASMAMAAGKPVAVLAGIVEDEPRKLFDYVYELHDSSRPLDETIRLGPSLLREAAAELGRELQILEHRR